MNKLATEIDYINLRSICKEKLEGLEHWLRRLIDGELSSSYGDYFSYQDDFGNRILPTKLSEVLIQRKKSEPGRYPRLVDAMLLSDVIDIVCKPNLWKLHFQEPLKEAFPDGQAEARTFLNRLSAPRNNLAHANTISIRQAEQVICYSNDIIDSLKSYYRSKGMNNEYNIPIILKFSDSHGSTLTREQFSDTGSTQLITFQNDPKFYLRPGDCLSIEVEADPSFPPETYTISWASAQDLSIRSEGYRFTLNITEKHVHHSFGIQCSLKTTNNWHRLDFGNDDLLIVYYKVLPPI